MIVDGVRTFLIGEPGKGGLDLPALNLQRGRDHGLPGFAAVRSALGMPLGKAPVYESTEDVDPWIGFLAELSVPGAMVGPTLQRLLIEPLQALREGDRFYYEASFPGRIVALMESQRLSYILQRNTDLGEELALDVFRVE